MALKGRVEMEGYKTSEVTKITGVKTGALHKWIKAGLVTPSVSEGGGFDRRDGYDGQRLFSFYDLIEIRAIKALRDAGIPLQKIRRIKDFDLTALPLLVSDGVDVYLTDEEGLTSLLEMPMQGVLFTVIELWRLRQEVEVGITPDQMTLEDIVV